MSVATKIPIRREKEKSVRVFVNFTHRRRAIRPCQANQSIIKSYSHIQHVFPPVEV